MNHETVCRAWRYIVHIRELGGEPILYAHGNHRAYAAALQHQYTRLSWQSTRTEIKAAKARAVALIKQKGLMKAAGIASPDQISPLPAVPAQQPGPPKPAVDEVFEPASTEDTAPIEVTVRITKSDAWNCRRKIRHQNSLSAMQHASQLQGHEVSVYGCPVCNGIHVGHDPDGEQTRRYRRLTRRLSCRVFAGYAEVKNKCPAQLGCEWLKVRVHRSQPPPLRVMPQNSGWRCFLRPKIL